VSGSLAHAARPHIPDGAPGVTLPPRYQEPWWERFLALLGPSLRPGVRILDVGSGRLPVLPPPARPAGARYVGLDVSGDELAAAPPASYDDAIVCDLTAWRPAPAEFDLVVCWQVLEHVAPLAAALENLRACLRPGGRMVAHLSGGRSAYALLNRAVPPALSQWALHRLLGRRHESVFPARYDHCTQRGLQAMLASWSRAEVTPLYRGATYFRFSPALQRLYLRYEDQCLRRGWADLATHYRVDARR
jgi:SAM-dependent methyltransferase